MTEIIATCPVCGDIKLSVGDVRLTVADSWAVYRFRCTQCYDDVTRPADEHLVSLLVSVDVAIDLVPTERSISKSAAAFTYDDLLDFALLLKHNEVRVDDFMSESWYLEGSP